MHKYLSFFARGFEEAGDWVEVEFLDPSNISVRPCRARCFQMNCFFVFHVS